jgi:hypothetical protein
MPNRERHRREGSTPQNDDNADLLGQAQQIAYQSRLGETTGTGPRRNVIR